MKNRSEPLEIARTKLTAIDITAYQNFNPHGDTTLISSPQGEEWIAARFDAFGNPLDGWELSYGYTSKWLREKDRDTMTIRMGVREYDPALGRFTSADPLKGDPTRPQSRNRYPYALNDPLTMYDLNGRQAAEAVAGGVIFVTLPVSAPVVVVGGAAAGVGATGAFLIFYVKPEQNLIQSDIYEQNRCLIPPPTSDTHWGPHGPNVYYDLEDEMLDQSDRAGGKPVDRDGSAADEFDDLTKSRSGGKPKPGYRYGKGTAYEYPDGTVIGYGPGADGTPTVEINQPGKGNRKYKYKK